jgi:DNA-binding XRE family transcriptional regulator
MRITVKAKIEDLQSLRIKSGYSLRALAKEARCSDSFLSQIERGVRNPSPQTALQICKALNCCFEDIFFTQRACKSNRTVADASD